MVSLTTTEHRFKRNAPTRQICTCAACGERLNRHGVYCGECLTEIALRSPLRLQALSEFIFKLCSAVRR